MKKILTKKFAKFSKRIDKAFKRNPYFENVSLKDFRFNGEVLIASIELEGVLKTMLKSKRPEVVKEKLKNRAEKLFVKDNITLAFIFLY